MTNEEAIKEIKEMVDYWEKEYPMATDEITAMKMAINALKFISYCSGWVQQWVKGEEDDF